MFNTISVELMRDFAIGATTLGQLSTYYFCANLLFLPIAGGLLDRFSTRAIILLALLLSLLGTTGFALTQSLNWAFLFRFMSGIGSSFCFLSNLRLVSRWFPSRLSLVIGLIATMAMMGGLIAQTPLTLLVKLLGWRQALLLEVGLGSLVWLAIWCWVIDYLVTQHRLTAQPTLAPISLLQSWRLAYLNPQNWLCGFYACAMNLPLALLGAIWGNLFLHQVAHFSLTQASLVSSLLFVGTLISGPVVGWLSDKIHRRIVFMVLGTLLALPLIFILIYTSSLPLTIYSLLFFLLGFVTSAQVLSYSLVREHNPHSLTATAGSVVSFLIITGYAVFQPLFGWLMDWYSQKASITQVPLYTASDYRRALWILPIAFLLALVSTCFLRESRECSGPISLGTT